MLINSPDGCQLIVIPKFELSVEDEPLIVESQGTEAVSYNPEKVILVDIEF